MNTVIRMHATGAPSVLKTEHLEAGAPGPGEVKLRQHAIGVNHVDTMVRDGRFPMLLPAIPGFEGAGTIEAVGPGVDLRVGQRAAYFFAAGAYAGERLVPASSLVPLPDDIAQAQAAAFLTKGLTAWMGLRALLRLAPGQTVLVLGASGGVGAILSRWARALGATVIGVAGSGAKLEQVRAGAHHALHAGDPDALAKLRAIAPGGVDVVYDFVGRAVEALALGAVRDGGAIVTIGAASGQAQFAPAELARRRIRVLGGATAQHATPHAADELFEAIRAGLFDDLPIVRYPLAQAARAHEDIAARTREGLAILLP